jgi:hypothetical protein
MDKEKRMRDTRWRRLLAPVTAFSLTVSAAGSAHAAWDYFDFNLTPGPEHVFVGTEANSHLAGKRLYVCRVLHNNAWHPGKILESTRQCNFGYGGRETKVNVYEILRAGGTWGNNGTMNALVGGIENGQDRFVCRAEVWTSGTFRGVHSGKVVDGNCNIPYGGAELHIAPFELFYPSTAMPPMNPPAFGTGNLSATIKVDAGAVAPHTCGAADFWVGTTRRTTNGMVILERNFEGNPLYKCQWNAFFENLTPQTYTVVGPHNSCRNGQVVTAGQTTMVTLNPTQCF